jgi:hypothetical protein
VPPLIRDVFELLVREEEDALVQLAAIRTLRGWLGGRERLSLAAARAQAYTWAEIGAAQGRPRGRTLFLCRSPTHRHSDSLRA